MCPISLLEDSGIYGTKCPLLYDTEHAALSYLRQINRIRHHNHQSFMELGLLLTRSGLTHPEVSLTVYHDFFCQLGNIVS